MKKHVYRVIGALLLSSSLWSLATLAAEGNGAGGGGGNIKRTPLTKDGIAGVLSRMTTGRTVRFQFKTAENGLRWFLSAEHLASDKDRPALLTINNKLFHPATGPDVYGVIELLSDASHWQILYDGSCHNKKGEPVEMAVVRPLPNPLICASVDLLSKRLFKEFIDGPMAVLVVHEIDHLMLMEHDEITLLEHWFGPVDYSNSGNIVLGVFLGSLKGLKQQVALAEEYIDKAKTDLGGRVKVNDFAEICQVIDSFRHEFSWAYINGMGSFMARPREAFGYDLLSTELRTQLLTLDQDTELAKRFCGNPRIYGSFRNQDGFEAPLPGDLKSAKWAMVEIWQRAQKLEEAIIKENKLK